MKIGCQIRQGNPSSYIMPTITLMYPRNDASTPVRSTGRYRSNPSRYTAAAIPNPPAERPTPHSVPNPTHSPQGCGSVRCVAWLNPSANRAWVAPNPAAKITATITRNNVILGTRMPVMTGSLP